MRGRSSSVRGLECRPEGDVGTVETLPAPLEQMRAPAKGRGRSQLPFLHISFRIGRQTLKEEVCRNVAVAFEKSVLEGGASFSKN